MPTPRQQAPAAGRDCTGHPTATAAAAADPSTAATYGGAFAGASWLAAGACNLARLALDSDPADSLPLPAPAAAPANAAALAPLAAATAAGAAARRVAAAAAAAAAAVAVAAAPPLAV